MTEMRRRARVTWFNTAKGYGEAVDKSGEVYFVREIDGSDQRRRGWKRGDSISFYISSEEIFGLLVAKDITTDGPQSQQQNFSFSEAEARI